LLKKWISSGNVNFKLIYRASRDGFQASNFHSKCDTYKCTLSIVNSNSGNKIFGGFVDGIDWTASGNYKSTAKAFLFSITDKMKYPIKSSTNMYATMANQSYGPTYGGGHDFMLCDNCNTVNSSYSNFGHTYDM